MEDNLNKNDCATENTDATKKQSKTKTKKKDESAAIIEKLNNELNEQKNLLLRTAAEFDNYKKRTEKEKLFTAEYAKATVLKQFLPIIDNVGRADCSVGDTADYAKGLEMIIKQFMETINKSGLVEIGEKGEKFDPNIHEAVMHIESDDFEENTVSEVLQKGYKIGDTVLRPAMVQVAN